MIKALTDALTDLWDLIVIRWCWLTLNFYFALGRLEIWRKVHGALVRGADEDVVENWRVWAISESIKYYSLKLNEMFDADYTLATAVARQGLHGIVSWKTYTTLCINVSEGLEKKGEAV